MDQPNLYGIKVKDKQGRELPMEEFKGRVLLIVNTATECGFTPQLEGLEALYQKFRDRGFLVLGFPSNQFANQEPRDDEEIGDFCQVNYGVSFPMFKKLEEKGTQSSELFRFLSEKKLNGRLSSRPRWNFHKYLVNRRGEVVDFYLPFTKPEARRLHRAIEKLLDSPED